MQKTAKIGHITHVVLLKVIIVVLLCLPLKASSITVSDNSTDHRQLGVSGARPFRALTWINVQILDPVGDVDVEVTVDVVSVDEGNFIFNIKTLKDQKWWPHKGKWISCFKFEGYLPVARGSRISVLKKENGYFGLLLLSVTGKVHSNMKMMTQE